MKQLIICIIILIIIKIIMIFNSQTITKIISPGIWYSIHIIAINISNYNDHYLFIKYLQTIIFNFPCEECQQHAINYIKTHPFEPYKDDYFQGKYVGFFRWSWKFHNLVNKRLHKPMLNWNDAYRLYTNPQICKSCKVKSSMVTFSSIPVIRMNSDINGNKLHKPIIFSYGIPPPKRKFLNNIGVTPIQ